MDSHCLFCNAPLDADRRLCGTHRRASGLPADAPMLREPDPCAKCGHPELVRSRAIRGRGCRGGDVGRPYVAPLGMSFGLREYEVDIDRGLLKRSVKEKRQKTDVESVLGAFEAYACRRCGFTEFYARGVADVPIGEEYGTELVVADPSDHPFR